MPAPSFTHARLLNEMHSCDAPGCSLPRSGIDRWCSDHKNTVRRYGHPSARALRPNRWATERAQVRALLAANSDHPGLQQVLSMLSAWKATGCANESSYPGAEEVARLSRHGVSALDILAEVCAFWAWLQANPRALPQGGADGDKAVDYAISRAVFNLAPRPKRVAWPSQTSYSRKARSSALASVGQHLRRTTAPFLINVAASIEPPDAKAARAAEAMRAPLRPSV